MRSMRTASTLAVYSAWAWALALCLAASSSVARLLSIYDERSESRKGL